MKLFLGFLLAFTFVITACNNKNTNEVVFETTSAYETELLHLPFIDPYNVKLEGYGGNIIDKCIRERIMGQNVNHLVEPFTRKDETRCWQSEFWGKWMLSAVAAYKYNHDAELLEKMKTAAHELMSTQLPTGYIGNYGPDNQLTHWDIWGRKYSMLGLIRYYEISGDQSVLISAMKVADHLMEQLGPDKVNIVQTGNYRGMASSSVLEPIVYLYNHTQNEKYLDFAEYIVTQLETEEGPQLISKGIRGVPVAERFPKPEIWWSWENGQKAYEMMSCYEGLLELYKVTKNSEYLNAVVNTVDNIIETEINIAGSGSAFECWYHGKEKQTQPTYHTMETCVTITWMKLCNNLLHVTGNPMYADHIEKSFFNALMASITIDGSQIAKYSPLEGTRTAGEDQCNMHINCCNANGPRGFVMMPSYAIMIKEKTIYINYFGESNTEVRFASGNSVKLSQTTSYPVDGVITIEVNPEISENFEIFIRIPAWSEQTALTINGEKQENILPGSYLKVSRIWEKGDKIVIQMDMRGRLIQHENHQAITRGPLVLARDSRLNDGFIDETAMIIHDNQYVNLKAVDNANEDIWLTFEAPCRLGTDLEGEYGEPKSAYFCDFASAGNTWDSSTRYRVWIRKTLNVMQSEYKEY